MRGGPSEQRLERCEGASALGEGVAGRGTHRCKGPEMQMSLVCSAPGSGRGPDRSDGPR